MKRIFCIICLFACVACMAVAAPKQVRVSTAEEFINALGDNREIIVCAEDGLLLTQALSDMIEARKIKEFDRQTRAKQVGVFYDTETDGPTIVISGYKNITIRSDVQDRRAIEVTPRYAYVLEFISCENLTFTNLLLGHTREGYCSNGVLGFDDCKNITITNCGLYGCGTEGIVARQCQNLQMTGSEIYECSYSIMHLFTCTDCTFTNCYFYKNKEYDLVGVSDSCEKIVFDNCTFAGNKGLLFNFDRQDNVKLNRCLIQHAGAISDDRITCDTDCIWIYE